MNYDERKWFMDHIDGLNDYIKELITENKELEAENKELRKEIKILKLIDSQSGRTLQSKSAKRVSILSKCKKIIKISDYKTGGAT